MADWKIPFPSIGDPSVSIAETLRKRGIMNIYVDVGKAKFYNKTDVPGRPLPGGRHKVGILQPAILALDSNANILYRWACHPRAENFGGAKGRPKASDVWAAIQRSLSGDFSAAEGEDGPSIPGVALPFVYLMLLANGNFIRPRRLTRALIPLSALKGLTVVACIVWAFTSLPQYRSAIGLLLACYALYFRIYVFNLFVIGWKMTSPIKRTPQPPMVLFREPPSLVTVVGFRSCQYHRRALEAAQDMAKTGLAGEVAHRTFESQTKFQEWLSSEKGRFGPRAQKHFSSPFVWLGEDIFIGGCDDLLALMKRLEVTRAVHR